MFLLAFPAGLAVRPVAKASVAFCAALALVLCAAAAFPCVGSSTFGAFAVPIVFGLPVMLAVHGLKCVPRRDFCGAAAGRIYSNGEECDKKRGAERDDK